MKNALALQEEIVRVLNKAKPCGMTMPGLEDRCDLWRTPKDLRDAVETLIEARKINVYARPLPPTSPTGRWGALIIYGAM